MDSVSNAVITVKKNLKDLDETTLTHLTEQAITLDELYGIDMNETLRGVNSLMEQYGLTAQQAMDYKMCIRDRVHIAPAEEAAVDELEKELRTRL